MAADQTQTDPNADTASGDTNNDFTESGEAQGFVTDTGDSEDVQTLRQFMAQSMGEWNISPAHFAADAEDPLLGCLVILTKLFERPMSPESMIANLPLENDQLTIPLFLRAAQRAQLSARVVRRSLTDISKLILPAVILLRPRTAAVLVDFPDGEHVEVILPDSGRGSFKISMFELQQIYTGYAIFVRPEYRFNANLEEKPTTEKGWFWSPMFKFWRSHFLVIVASFLINILALGLPLYTMNIYDRVVPNHAVDTMWVLSIGISLIFVFEALIKVLRDYFMDLVGKKAGIIMGSDIFGRVLNLKMRNAPRSSGAFAQQIREFQTVQSFLTSATMTTLVDIPFLVIYVAVIWVVAGPMAWLAVATIPLVLLVSLLLLIPQQKLVKETQKDMASQNAVLMEAINGVELVKMTGAEGKIQATYERLLDVAGQASGTSKLFMSIATNFSAFVQQAVVVVMVIVGVYRIQEGVMTTGALVATTMLVGRALRPLSQMASLLLKFQDVLESYRLISNIMAMEVDRPEGKSFVSKPIQNGSVEVKDVTFSYPGQELEAIKNVSFKIKPGEKVAIIGKSGSGKSTILRLMLGLYEPDAGNILIDGTDIRQIDPSDLRRGIGGVSQDAMLFTGSIRENIVIGAAYADDNMIRRAALVAGVDDWVSQHPLGYDLWVGERGKALSGGQRQMVSIARGLLLDPAILMMDEPTSSLDTQAENRFKMRLEKTLHGKTLILVTHRTSLLTLVDRLIVFDQGKIIADGPKDAVVAQLQRANRQQQAGVTS